MDQISTQTKPAAAGKTRAIKTSPGASMLLTPREAARLLGLSHRTLEADRATGHLAVPFVRLGRYIKYRLTDLENWIEAHTVRPGIER